MIVVIVTSTFLACPYLPRPETKANSPKQSLSAGQASSETVTNSVNRSLKPLYAR